MEAKHTPGPWETVQGINRNVFNISKIDNHEADGIPKTIAQAHGWLGGYSVEVLKANSALIAASPDLLEALKGAVYSLSKLHDAINDEVDGSCWTEPEFDSDMVKARAAIKEGQRVIDAVERQ